MERNNPHQKKGFFLTIEGIEGVGKSSALQFLQAYLKEKNIEGVFTREPGGTPIAEQLRAILLTPQTEQITSDTELLLMFAARSQHIANIIKPALDQDKWVISDRFIDATFAYQGGGRQLSMDFIAYLEKMILNDLQPDATILLDAPPNIGLARAKNKGEYDRIEQEKLDFFERVRSVYLQRAKQFSDRFYLIDATRPLKQVQKEITYFLEKRSRFVT